MSAQSRKRKTDSSPESRPAKRLKVRQPRSAVVQSDVWEDVPIDFVEPPINLLSLPLQIREHIYENMLEDVPDEVVAPHSLAHWLLMNTDGQCVNGPDPRNMQHTFFAKVLPKGFYMNKQVLYEASLVFLRRTMLSLYNSEQHQSAGLLHKYLSSFSENQGYKSVRRLKILDNYLFNWGKGALSPHSILSTCPGIRELDISISYYDLLVLSLWWYPGKHKFGERKLLSPLRFDREYKLSRLCSFKGSLTLNIRYARAAFKPFIETLQREIEKRGAKITIGSTTVQY
ncbi:hypothetical protein BU23DRAFT_571965 [Bimuria novae-zelandiae CBS 107.79]|uniref:Uncharacterized protein n=1 Tax=Bimuria novae-zelandiae CBS 107.79 TaxID=1447943 RepID=A0A6A5UY64_9PLEO|nr:hypothetical protein BU23DRAFT_571965 [Bimuria novae-zelandiae CBS 107.79]